MPRNFIPRIFTRGIFWRSKSRAELASLPHCLDATPIRLFRIALLAVSSTSVC